MATGLINGDTQDMVNRGSMGLGNNSGNTTFLIGQHIQVAVRIYKHMMIGYPGVSGGRQLCLTLCR
ncbi:hypothetical protein MPL1_07762 [Methylophaga lonarensis MPL]|uniref:Uncharacterized protein n=1 Tax=Methylophaga lonarensis MPL TaxID=1286106 RepID=M7PGA5_9GAMM|nr:hypothetical protein MPL1_07762 [Methylophaga lonarensis MPL]